MTEITMRGSWIGGPKKGDPAFEIGSNYYGPFQIGFRNGDDHWLQGLILGGPEFLFNGRVFLPQGAVGTVIDNFPKGPIPDGWTQRRIPSEEGYELVDGTGKTLFGYRVHDKLCRITVNLYSADGRLIAESLPDEFRLNTNLFWAGIDAVRDAP
jgi:hypothetical protein